MEEDANLSERDRNLMKKYNVKVSRVVLPKIDAAIISGKSKKNDQVDGNILIGLNSNAEKTNSQNVLIEKYNVRPCSVQLTCLTAQEVQRYQKPQKKAPPNPKQCQKKTVLEKIVDSEEEYAQSDNNVADEDGDGSDSDYEDIQDKKRKKRACAAEPAAKRRTLSFHMCDKCTFAATSKKLLEKHSILHESNIPAIDCPYEGCGAISISDYDHKRHIFEYHEGVNQLQLATVYSCKGCEPPQQFIDLHSCECHIVNHVTPMPKAYKCSVCARTFVKFDSFKEHMKCHINFKCTFCESLYPKLDQIESHCQTSHAQYGRPFGCDICEYRSSVFGLLSQHKEERHGIVRDRDVEKCKFCIESDYVFSDYGDMIIHLAEHCDVHIYSCSFCTHTSNDVNVLGAHVTSKHQDDVTSDDSTGQIFVPVVGPDMGKLIDGLLYFIKHKASSRALRQKFRSKPSFSETQEAVATLLQSSVSETSDDTTCAIASLGETSPSFV